jgi:hypothetical protein
MQRMDEPPDETCEVIPVQMGDKYRRNGIRINALARKSDERRGAAIDEELAAFMGNVETGLQAPPRTEGVARTDDRKLHAVPPRTWSEVAPV